MAEPESGRQAWTAAYSQARLTKAYTEGWDAGNDFARKEVADLLERSGREREELEERIEQLKNSILIFLAHEYPDGTDHPADIQAELLRRVALSDLKKEGQG